MDNIDLENHFGEPLQEELQLPHEQRARAFMGVAEGYVANIHPEVSLSSYYLTGIDIFKGEEAEIALKNWNNPEMDEYRDPNLKDYLLEQVEKGKQADIESVDQSQVRCIILGDNEDDLNYILKRITLYAAEKGGVLLPDMILEKNILAGLRERDPEGEWDELSKQFSQTSHFVFT